MAGEIGTVTSDGLSLYATIQALNKSNFWTSGDTFETFNAAHWANYTTLAVTELTGSSGTYVASFPTVITTADEYTVVVRQKVGGSNAVTDPVIAIGTITWNGTAAETLNSASSTDPWAAALPGSYGSGTAGSIVGNNLNAAVSTRSTYAGGAVAGISGVTFPAAVPSLSAIQAALPADSSIVTDVQSGLTAQGFTSARAGYIDTLNGIVAAIWAATTRTLTAISNSAGITTLLTYFSGAVAPQSGDAYARLGAPAGASVSADIATANSALSLSLSLIGQNQGVRNQQYDGSGNLLSADICAYDTAAHATTNDGATGLVHKWSLALTYTGGLQAAQSIAQVS